MTLVTRIRHRKKIYTNVVFLKLVDYTNLIMTFEDCQTGEKFTLRSNASIFYATFTKYNVLLDHFKKQRKDKRNIIAVITSKNRITKVLWQKPNSQAEMLNQKNKWYVV